MLLSAAATMRTVLRSKLAYSEVTLHDLAGWIADHPTSSVSRRKMAVITLERLEQYLGLCTCVDIIHKKNVEDNWSWRNPITSYFGRVMSYRRFAMLQRVFHVSIQEPASRGHVNFDTWNKVRRPILGAMNETFITDFLPLRCASIDERMVGG